MKNLVNEELNKMKYLLGYQRGMVISEQDATAATAKDVIKQIQRILVDKYKVDLGKTGDKYDGVDGDCVTVDCEPSSCNLANIDCKVCKSILSDLTPKSVADFLNLVFTLFVLPFWVLSFPWMLRAFDKSSPNLYPAGDATSGTTTFGQVAFAAAISSGVIV